MFPIVGMLEEASEGRKEEENGRDWGALKCIASD
jgi:hypothetical protein